MGNCYALPSSNKKKKRKNKQNPFSIEYGGAYSFLNGSHKSYILEKPTGQKIGDRYMLGEELGRGEFGITYPCTDKSSGETFACKSISKKKLLTRVDIEDVRREVEIMRNLPPHPHIVSLKDTYEDDSAVHLVMELCEGGELFDRIVARGHYTERAAIVVTRTMAEVIQVRDSMKLWEVLITWLPRCLNETMARKLMCGVPELSSISCFVGSHLFGQIIEGVNVFRAETEQGVALAILRSVVDFKREPWPTVSDSAKDLVKKMLNPNPKLRLTAQQVLYHPWLTNAKKAPNVNLCEAVRARLQQFSVMNKLKKTALKVIAEHLSVEETAAIKEGFQVMDRNNRGKITIGELRVGLLKLGHQVAEADLLILMEAGDVDKDGYLDCGEFVAISVHLKRMSGDHLHKAFEYFDKNQSRYIEIDELRDALADDVETDNEDVVNAIMSDVDTDKDGRISYDEFAAMMKDGTD